MENFKRRFSSAFKNHRKVWAQLASEIGAEFVNNGLFKSPEVIKKGESFLIKLDSFRTMAGNHSQSWTRFQTLCETNNDFRFRILRKNIFNKRAPKGMELMMTDVHAFDRKFRLFVSHKREMKKVFNWDLLTNIAGQQPFNAIRIELKDKKMELKIRSLIKDIEQLRSLFNLVEELRNQFNPEL